MRGWLAGAALVLAAAGGVPAGSTSAAQAGPDATTSDAAPAGADARGDPCAALVEQLRRRRQWLAARHEEQLDLGGAPDPSRWIINATQRFCEEHPTDPDCTLPPLAVALSPNELSWTPDASFDDFEPHVLRMVRELRDCRSSQR